MVRLILPPARKRRGFTLLEVMVAILLAMIGLLGTVAIQQTLLNANTNANEAATAMRLAMMRLEYFNTLQTFDSNGAAPADVDQLADYMAQPAGSPIGAGWRTEHFNNMGQRAPGNPTVWSSEFRFAVESRVCVQTSTSCVATPTVGAPYAISVRVVYSTDLTTSTGALRQKEVRIDAERRKPW